MNTQGLCMLGTLNKLYGVWRRTGANVIVCHGCRILSRTWICDPFLHKLAQQVVLGKGSMAQLIQHSDLFRNRYRRHTQMIENNPVFKARLKSLSAAKHRFDSLQKPFGRSCLTFEAMLTTAQELHEERRTETAGRNAKEFLQLMMQEEAVISLGMMADAGDEAGILIRYLDQESFDKKTLAAECFNFLERVAALFEHKVCKQTGYTAHMIACLQKQKVLFIDRKPYCLGGLSRGSKRAEACCSKLILKASGSLHLRLSWAGDCSGQV